VRGQDTPAATAVRLRIRIEKRSVGEMLVHRRVLIWKGAAGQEGKTVRATVGYVAAVERNAGEATTRLMVRAEKNGCPE